MGIDAKIADAVEAEVERCGQPKAVANRLKSLLDHMADAGLDLNRDDLLRRIDDVLEKVEVSEPVNADADTSSVAGVEIQRPSFAGPRNSARSERREFGSHHPHSDAEWDWQDDIP